jgi:hypothetical protein
MKRTTVYAENPKNSSQGIWKGRTVGHVSAFQSGKYKKQVEFPHQKGMAT